MNFTEIQDLALAYADREDDEVTTRMDKFILLVEARINRKLKTLDMSARSVIDLTVNPDQEYYQVPTDFGGLRDIEVNTGPRRKTLVYLNPEQMNNVISSGGDGINVSKIYYSIVAQQIQIYPLQSEGNLEIIYYQRVIPLTAAAPNNWISDEFPDCYIHGIVQEISAFAKDAEAFKIWKGRFDESLAEVQLEDRENRWSGTPLEVKVG